ncbi:MAG TPA: FtsX-like permease family protein [Chlamydiales bacterium]|nr:FtsX-like permease family protein [Chlamydiales bacterium]
MWLYVAYRNLFRNVRRTVAILLTVGMGAGALFSFAGFIEGILNEYRESVIHSHYGYGQIHTKGYRDTVFEDPTKHWIQDWGYLSLFLMNQKEVKEAFPRITFSALLNKGNVTLSGHGEGIVGEKEAEFFTSLNIEEGEPLRNQSGGILLGKGLADALKVHPGDSLTVMATSAKAKLNHQKFIVTGIFHTGNAQFDKSMFRIQLKDAQNLLNTSHIETVSLALHRLSDWDEAATAIQKRFPHLEATAFDELDKIYYKHSIDWLNAQFGIVLIIILGIVLLGIFNTVSAAILERKQEIGNLRANGESAARVMRLIAAEGALLSFFGSVFGIALTYIFLTAFIHHGLMMPPGPGQTRQFLVTFAFTWPIIWKTIAYSALAAIVASLLAGIKVVRMPIAKALNSL